MSAIFGLGYFDGRPVPPKSLAAMQAVMSAWGPDGCHCWQQDNAGLGHALLVVTPNSRYETMPLHDLEKKQVLVAAARLDNRDELCDTFGIPYSERPATPNGRLVQLAFQRWGESCPKKLYGDWSLAVWDYRRQRLFLARDQLGNTGLFYYHKPPFFAFASNPKALLALAEVPRQLNEWQLARFLLIFSYEYGSQTFWQGLRLLLPGTSATITAEGFKTQLYWHLGLAPAVRFGSEAEYLDSFLDHYRRAVRCRLESLRPIGTHLSCGLDSGSVTTLSAEILRQRGERLTSFTAAPMYQADALVPGKTADEWPLAQATAAHCGNVQHVPVRAEAVSPLTGLERLLDIFHEPVHGSDNMYWYLAIQDKARRNGLGVILSADLGNGSVSWDGGSFPVLHQFLRGDFRGGRRSLTAWKQRHGSSWLATLKRHLLGPAKRFLWTQGQHLCQPDSYNAMEQALIHPDLSRRLELTPLIRKRAHTSIQVKLLSPESERFYTFMLNAPCRGVFAHAVGSAYAMEIRDPTADVKLVEYCLGLPEEQYIYQGGDRMLLRRGMKDLMSPAVLWNTKGGRQAADLIWRLLHHRNEVEDLLDRLTQSPGAKEYLNFTILKQAWQTVQRHQTPQTAQTIAGVFMRGLAAGIFLEKL